VTEWDVVVIGGGVAGLQAGVYTAKAGEETLVVDAGDSWVAKTNDIQNLIGFDSLSGETLLEDGREQLRSFGGELLEDTVQRVEDVDDGFLIFTDDAEYRSEYVLVASAGATDFLAPLDLAYVAGVEGEYYPDRHVASDEANRATDGVYVAGLSRTWEYQTAVAIGDGAKAAINLLSEKYGEPYMDHDV